MIVNERQFTIGADPELFLRSNKEKEHYFFCAHGLIPGTKENPFRVKHGHLQVDGFAAEINIDPVNTKTNFNRNLRSVIGALKERVTPMGYSVTPQPVAFFRDKDYDDAPDVSKELGCNPDWNAYTEKLTPTPNPPKENFRTGAGHIHIGWGKNFKLDDPNLMQACFHLVKHLDTCLGKPISEIEGFYKRKNLYGAEGAFRPTTYGVEYRTLSNYWLSHPDLVNYVWDQTQTAIENAFNKTKYSYQVKSPPNPSVRLD